MREYYEQHKEEINQRGKQRYWTNREERLAQMKQYRDSDKPKDRLRHQTYYIQVHIREQERNFKRRQELLAKLGKVCAFCGFSDSRALQVDHINNDGYQERKRESISKTYRRILTMSNEEAKQKYRILCANCNWIKKHETNMRFKKWFGEK